MLASIWLSAAGLCLIFWYKLCKGPMRRALGIDPFRVMPRDQDTRPLPLWLLIAGQVTLLVGVAPMYSTALLLRFGLLPALLWTLLGAMLLGTLPYFVTLWATLRSGGKSVGGLMYEYLGGRGKQALAVLGWLLCVLTLAMMVGVVASGWDNQPQEVRAEDYLADPEAYRLAQERTARGEAIDITPFMDSAAFEAARDSVAWEAAQRSTAATASLGMLALSVLYGLLLMRLKREPLPTTVLAVAVMGGIVWLSAQYPLALPHDIWTYLLLGYALMCALMPQRWLSVPRDALVGLLTLGAVLVCTMAVLFTQAEVTQPLFAGWHVPDGGNLLPFLCMTTVAGGVNAVYMLSAGQRTEHAALREDEAHALSFGGALAAAFVGLLVIVAAGQYAALPLEVLSRSDVLVAPRLLQGSVISLMVSVGVPMEWASVWVTLACVGCAMGALDMSARLGASLLHGIYFNQSGPSHPLALDRLLAAFITVVGAFLLSNIEYWTLWPLFGTASLGACAVALLPVIVWLRQCGRRVWTVLAGLAGVLAALAIWGMVASIMAQIRPTLDNLLSSGTLFLHIVVALLMLLAMIHALTGIGRPPREIPPMRGPRGAKL